MVCAVCLAVSRADGTISVGWVTGNSDADGAFCVFLSVCGSVSCFLVCIALYRCKLNVCPALPNHSPRHARSATTAIAVLFCVYGWAKPIVVDHKKSVRHMPAPHASRLNTPIIRHS